MNQPTTSRKAINAKYLETTAIEAEYAEEIKSRFGQARTVYNRMKNVLCTRDLNLQLTVRKMRLYVSWFCYMGWSPKR